MQSEGLSAPQFYYFTIPEIFFINFKPQQGTHLVPALPAGCTWVQVQTLQFFVVHYF